MLPEGSSVVKALRAPWKVAESSGPAASVSRIRIAIVVRRRAQAEVVAHRHAR